MATSTNEFPFDIWLKKLKSSKDEIATKLAEVGRDFFIREFDEAKWDKEKWPEVQRNISGTDANKYNKYAGNPPLVNTGELRQALVDCIKEKAWNKIKWEVDSEYASYHNEGTEKIPKRQFIGESYELNKLLAKTLEQEIVKIVK